MAKPTTGKDRISAADLKRLQAHLQSALGCASLSLEQPATRSGSVQLSVGGEVIGTVDQVDDEGERSWAVTLVVLEEDMAG